MLFGEYERTVDAKGRLTLPSHLMVTGAQFDWSRIVVVKGDGPSLFLFDALSWQRVLGAAQHALDDEDARLFMHRRLPDAQVCELDSLNRVTIPGALLAHAGIEKKLVLVGLFNRLELWDPTRWQSFLDQRAEVEVPDLSDVSRASMREVS